MTQKTNQIFQIKVTLDNVHPPIWRHILVTGNTTLFKLHDILQIAMGWEDYHLHMFVVGKQIYGAPEDDEFGELGSRDEAKYKLNQVIHRKGQHFTYEYDFGDSWDHTLFVEKIMPLEKGVHYPLCLAGERACPPEDAGGVGGYEYFLEAIQDPNHDEHDEYLEWIGGEFDPEAFDLAGVNAELHSMGRGRSADAEDAWASQADHYNRNLIASASTWMQNISDDQRFVSENLSLRQDMLTFLHYLDTNKVTGTQSTGNLPLKAVREICAGFVHPPKLDEEVGEIVIRVRTETEVWPLYFRHLLASVGGLIEGGTGRRWKLSPLSEQFRTSPAPLQVWFLFATWCEQINWTIASPFGYVGGYLPEKFTQITIHNLLDLSEGAPISYKPFADHLIEEAKLIWPIQDQHSARDILRNLIERTVINPMADFEVVKAEYRPDKILGNDYPQITSFKITRFGKSLLESIKQIQAE